MRTPCNAKKKKREEQDNKKKINKITDIANNDVKKNILFTTLLHYKW